ncbi:MAG: sugar phosphate nucleotidyltransferase [Oscillospiraceae bacterium]
MKAVIMAGGKGVRLMPLTCDTPKPLSPLLGKAVVVYILELLKKHNINQAVLTLGYQGERLEAALLKKPIVDLEFSKESKPLGTAGGVKYALGEYDGEVIVISGDAMCDFDLTRAIDFHRNRQSDVTIITKKVDDPREYGLVCADGSGRITSFLEKPSYLSCVTDIANTGVYILSPKVLCMIESGKNSDFAQDIFPEMLKRKMKLYSYEESGYWCDIGDIKSYMQCQYDMLDSRVDCTMIGRNEVGCFIKKNLPNGAYNIIPNVYIGENVTIGNDTKIDKHTVIEDNVSIGNNCEIRGAILQAGCHIGNNVTIYQAVLAVNSSIEDDVTINEGCVIGSGAVVLQSATLSSGVKVWDNKTVEAGMILSDDLKYGFAREILIEEDGIVGQTNVTITPSLCTKIGGAVASLCDMSSIGLAFNCQAASKAMAFAIMSGIMAAGENVWSFGECTLSQFEFCMQKSQVDFGIYINSSMVTSIKITQKSAMPMSRKLERKLEAGINKSEYKKVSVNQIGCVKNVESMSKLYAIELLKLCDASLDGLEVMVKTGSNQVRAHIEEALTILGCVLSNQGIEITLSVDGKQVSMRDGKGVELYHEKILALLCLGEFLKGESVSLPHTAPKIINKLAQIHGQSVYRYCECPCDESDKIARKKAIAKPFLRDGLMMAIKLLSFMVEKNLDFQSLHDLIPDFNTSSRLVFVSANPSHILKKLSTMNTEISEGIDICMGGETAYIKPIKSGKGIMIYTEGKIDTTAVEIGDIFESIVKDARLDS